MTNFEEMVAFLYQECVNWKLLDGNVKRYTMKARFGLTKDFYVNFDNEKCSMWHSELEKLDMAIITTINLRNADFKTHVDIQKELDRIL